MTGDRAGRPGRRRVLRSGRRLAVVGAAAAFTVLLAQHTTTAAFTAQTGDAGNSASTAASFCATPGGTTVAASADTTGYQQNPTTLYGTSVDIGAGSGSGANGRVLVKFALPGLGAHCVVTAATLRLYAHTPQAGRTIDVYRVDPAAPAWSEASTNWNNQPTTTGTAVGVASLASAGWQQWTVTSMVTSMYAGTNSGFLLRDRTEGSGTPYWQLYAARENATVANRPQLVLTWG
jgi:hypothetical protein